MAQWEDDLRAVVEHRGAALVARAETLVLHDEGADRAVGLTVDALVAAFRRGGRRTTGEHGSIRLVDDDELDALAAQVGREQDRLARASRAGEARRDPARPPAPSPDDGPSDQLTAHLPDVVARVRAARRRGRRQGLVASAAVVVVAALATTAFTAWPWGRSSPEPTPSDTPYAGACGSTLPTGRSLAPVTYDRSASITGSTVAADGWWAPAYLGGLTEPTSDELDLLDLLDSLTPEVVLARGGMIVALGVDVREVAGDGWTSEARPTLADLTPDSPLYVPVRFTACDGGAVEPGTYQAYLFATTDDRRTHVLSDPTALTVLSTTPDGYQPSWLTGSALACGESADDFVVRAWAHPVDQLDQTGSSLDDDGEVITLRNNGTEPRKVMVPRGAVAWVKDGRIVGVGPDERAATQTTVGRGKRVEVPVRPWDTTDYCAPTADGEPGPLPAGTYQTIVYARIPAGDPSQPDRWILEDDRRYDVLVHDDGSAGYDDAAGTAALALATKGYQPSWVRGGPLTCGMTDEEFQLAGTENAAAGIDGTFGVDEEGWTGSLLTGPGGRMTTVTTPRGAGLAWFTDFRGSSSNRLVSLGSDPGPGRRTTLDGDAEQRAMLDSTDSCAPGARGRFTKHLPAGNYLVAHYTWVRKSGGERQWLVDGGMQGVSVGEDGSVASR
ncbi:hypothetical protein ACFT5B_02960 [Luteimicrobium sp. NPDC057192]|uniref:hypothetical protein n=1 Tax=Luteimicrobium sp. NPDC057192 TaxID=3346042 RepID=UPI0036266911